MVSGYERSYVNVNLMFELYDFGDDNTGIFVTFTAEWQKMYEVMNTSKSGWIKECAINKVIY